MTICVAYYKHLTDTKGRSGCTISGVVQGGDKDENDCGRQRRGICIITRPRVTGPHSPGASVPEWHALLTEESVQQWSGSFYSVLEGEKTQSSHSTAMQSNDLSSWMSGVSENTWKLRGQWAMK